MDFFGGYILGLMVALVTMIATHNPVTANVIEKAQAACVDNKGLKEIDSGEFRCINGAVFEQGDVK